MFKRMFKILMRYLADERGFVQFLPAAIAAGSALYGATKKRKAPGPVNVTPLMQTIQQGAERQRQQVGTLRPSLQPFTQNLQTGTTAAVNQAQEASRAASTKYLQDIGKTFDNTGDQFARTLSQRVLEQQPALNQQNREALAASGGLNRGAASRSLVEANRGLATDLSRGQTDLALQQAQEKQNATRSALDKINTMDNTFITNKLGIDRDTLNTVFQTGRQDLIDEATKLLGINTNEDQAKLDLQKFGINQNYAGSAANAVSSNANSNALLQGGLQGLLQILMSKGGK